MVPEREETLLLTLLNSTPVVRSRVVDELADEDSAAETLRGWGGSGTHAELHSVRAARADLQAVVRTERPAAVLGAHLIDVAQIPITDDGHLRWQLTAGSHHRLLAARAVLAFFELAERAPGRLRPCENDTCRLFLIDRSRAGTARWCSMAVCGNRTKARRHADRTRGADSERSPT